MFHAVSVVRTSEGICLRYKQRLRSVTLSKQQVGSPHLSRFFVILLLTPLPRNNLKVAGAAVGIVGVSSAELLELSRCSLPMPAHLTDESYVRLCHCLGHGVLCLGQVYVCGELIGSSIVSLEREIANPRLVTIMIFIIVI